MKVFITGVSSGVGEALAGQLVGAGHTVWGVALREELLRKIQSELGADKFLFAKCDVGNENEVENTLKLMRAANFLPDVVVLNAAVLFQDVNFPYQHSLFKQALAVNVFGSLIWVDKFLPDFLKRGSGSFIAISSISAYLLNADSISYSVSKAALSMAFNGLRTRYWKDKIKFSVVYFGPIATDLIPSWSFENGKPRYPFVLSRKKAAEKVIKVINSKAGDYWFPFFATSFLRLSLLLPGDILSNIFKYLKKISF